jgi:quercetin dioxygenase-like cupin family protein
MKITRLYAGADGESHFEDIDIPLKDIGGNEVRSETFKANGIIFRETGAKFDYAWHNAPARQYVITLQGRAEIRVGDGTKRRFGPGDIMLAEDLTGKGHITRAVGNKPRISIFVTLDQK